MPKSMLGLQGLNPWNVLFFGVVLSWIVNRGQERLYWDMPGYVGWLLLAYLLAVAVATVRSLADPSWVSEPFASRFGEQVINTIKWPIVGLMLFDGCRSRSRFTMGLAAILILYFLIGLQVIRWMPWSALTAGRELEVLSRKLLSKEVGFHPVNLSMMFGGAFWAMWVVSHAKIDFLRPTVLVVMSGFMLFAQALTAGRMGYVTWAALGLFFSVVRWRKYLVAAPLLIPVIVFVAMAVAPGAVERMLKGFSKETADDSRLIGRRGGKAVISNEGPDMYTVTSGRTAIWPYVIAKIGEAPVFGHGRQAMMRTGLYAFLAEKYLEEFPHPHNAYLELLLDTGVVGFLLIIPFYIVVLKMSISLFRDARSPTFMVSGGVATALVLALLVASMGSQTFYAREGSVGMWCAIGLMLRVFVERERVMATDARYVPQATAIPEVAVAAVAPAMRARQPGTLLRQRATQSQESTDPVDQLLWARAA
jgi:O-antigen ligase